MNPGDHVTLTASATSLDLSELRWMLTTPGGTLSALQGPSSPSRPPSPLPGGSTTIGVATYQAAADRPFALATATITVTG